MCQICWLYACIIYAAIHWMALPATSSAGHLMFPHPRFALVFLTYIIQCKDRHSVVTDVSLPQASTVVDFCWPVLVLMYVVQHVAAAESDLSMRLLVQANVATFGTWLAMQSRRGWPHVFDCMVFKALKLTSSIRCYKTAGFCRNHIHTIQYGISNIV